MQQSFDSINYKLVSLLLAAYSFQESRIGSLICNPKGHIILGSTITTMHHQDKYTLTWHSYSDHLRESLRDMMTTSEFADVTLVTDDKEEIRAHRNILSACSPVFKDMLQNNRSNTESVIDLRGIQHSEMESIMEFIYLGEARIYEDRMTEFLIALKNLEIKELSTLIETNQYEEPTQTHGNDANVEPQTCTTKPMTLNISTSNRITRVDCLKYSCNKCDKQFKSQGNLTRHIKSAHEGVIYSCNECEYKASDKGNLKVHIQAKHEGVKYACDQCDYQTSWQKNLKRHNDLKH